MSDDLDEAQVLLDPRDALGPEEIIRRLPKYWAISVASKRNSGKSYLCRQLVQDLIKKKQVDIVLVLSGTADLNDDWDFLPKGCVIDFSEAVLHRVWNRQKKLVLERNAKKTAGVKEKDLPKVEHVLIVLDDCLAEPEAVRSPIIRAYYIKGRHICVSILVISQHTSLLLTTIIRGNSDIILFSKLNKQQLDSLWESTAGIDRCDFVRVAESCCGVNFNFMLYDNYIQSRDPLEFLSVVRARPEKKR